MLHITKQSQKCCGTCEHWNGVRVHEDDGHVYSLGDVEAVCRKLVGSVGAGRRPLTLPSEAACGEWEGWRADSPPAAQPAPPRSRVARAIWRL